MVAIDDAGSVVWERPNTTSDFLHEFAAQPAGGEILSTGWHAWMDLYGANLVRWSAEFDGPAVLYGCGHCTITAPAVNAAGDIAWLVVDSSKPDTLMYHGGDGRTWSRYATPGATWGRLDIASVAVDALGGVLASGTVWGEVDLGGIQLGTDDNSTTTGVLFRLSRAGGVAWSIQRRLGYRGWADWAPIQVTADGTVVTGIHDTNGFVWAGAPIPPGSALLVASVEGAERWARSVNGELIAISDGDAIALQRVRRHQSCDPLIIDVLGWDGSRRWSRALTLSGCVPGTGTSPPALLVTTGTFFDGDLVLGGVVNGTVALGSDVMLSGDGGFVVNLGK